MNCEEFELRMHQRLDDRMPIDSDRDLSRHAAHCESCRDQMHAWSKVAAVMSTPAQDPPASDPPASDPPASDPPASDSACVTLRFGSEFKRSRGILSAYAGLSAAALIAVTTLWYASTRSDRVVDSDRVDVDSVGLDDREIMLAQATGELDPAGWWRSVQDRDWVSQTMPAVQSVKDGVAPIGRSLMRAVTILTLSGNDQTS